MKRAVSDGSPKADFFISYTRSDLDWAKWITWQLENEGYTCEVQFQDFHPGTDFMQRMRDALKNARQTIALLSNAYLKSEYAQAELNAALRLDPLGVRASLLPIRVGECEPLEILQGRIYIDLLNKEAAQARRVLLEGVAASRLAVDGAATKIRFDAKPSFPQQTRVSKSTRSSGASVELNTSPASPITILFVASEANTGLQLREQFRQMKLAVKSAPHSRMLRFEAIFNVTPERLFEALNGCNPTIVHFSGKQDGGNILMSREGGGFRTVSDTALAGLLRSLDCVRLAIIDTCYSLTCATSITEAVDAAIGVKSFIYEDNATSFYCAFYKALASKKSLRDATAQAVACLEFQGIPKAQIPQLRTRSGVDAKRIFLLGG